MPQVRSPPPTSTTTVRGVTRKGWWLQVTSAATVSGGMKQPLRATRAAAAGRLTRLGQKAEASGRVGPFVTLTRRAGAHELVDRGAALTYYTVLSLIPGLLVLFSVIGLFGTESTVDEVLSIIDDVGPSSGDALARDPIESLIRHDVESGFLLGSGLIAIVWTASAYMGSFFRASAVIWDVERRPAWRAWPLRIAFTVVMLILLAIALLLITLTGQLASSVGDALGIGEEVLDLYGFLKWPALLVVVTLLVGLLYRASPGGERSPRKFLVLTVGGAAAVATWMVVSIGFEVYVNAFATYNDTYGALGTTIAGLVWLWLTNLTLLFGVELDAALEIRRASGPQRQEVE
jgi:membrane protein